MPHPVYVVVSIVLNFTCYGLHYRCHNLMYVYAFTRVCIFILT